MKGGEGGDCRDTTITGYRKLLVTFMDIPKVAIMENSQFAKLIPFVWIVLKAVLKLKHQ
jgi:hypothetical protein